jgi:multimeric flavodoxin WrbA
LIFKLQTSNMKIVILNGNIDPLNNFSGLEKQVSEQLGNEHDVMSCNLSELNIRQCIGCWNCWCKTPGICVHKDEATQVMRSIIHADLVVFASPMMKGFTSSLLKRLQDRMIVLIHPYIEVIEDECHHRKRYAKHPDFALLIQKEADTDEEDMEITTTIYKRLALNFHCQLKHVWIYQPELEEVL